MSSEEDLIVKVRDGVGIIKLNRPAKLNCLTMAMIRKFRKTIHVWDKKDSGIKAILVKGSGRAFCSGGDVQSLYDGDSQFHSSYLKEEYSLDMEINQLRVPYVAVIDGITMGGGLGISVNGKYRIATKRTVMAMPECAIGLVPDVGAGHFLAKLKGHLGIFLGLTGYRLEGRDCVGVGLATHYFSSKEGWEKLDKLENELAKVGDVDIDTLLDTIFETKKNRLSFDSHLDMIDHIFSLPTLGEVIEGLQAIIWQEGDEGQVSRFAKDILSKMEAVSPSSLKLTFLHLKDRETKPSLVDSLSEEQRMQSRCLASQDFREGVRVTLIEKDRGLKPIWNPRTIKEANSEHVGEYLRPLPSELTLQEDNAQEAKAWAKALGMNEKNYLLAKGGRVNGQIYAS